MVTCDYFYKFKELQNRKETVNFAQARCCGSLLKAIETSPAQISKMECGCSAVLRSELEKCC